MTGPNFEFRCKAILRALHRAGGVASERQLAQAIGVAGPQRKRFGDYLRSLVLRKILRSRAGLYRTIEPAAPPAATSPPVARRNGGALIEGTVAFDRRGQAHLLSVDPPLALPFEAASRSTLINGDQVRAMLVGDRLQDAELVRRDGRWLCGVTRAAGRRVYVELDGPRPAVRMHLERVSVQPDAGHIVRLRASRWPDRRNRLAAWWGIIEEMVGAEGCALAERERLVFHYGFGRPFDGPTLQAARQLPRHVRAVDLEGRADLRTLPLVAIAEAGASVDHAWMASLLTDGRLRLSLSVIDVAHYVAPGTPLDRAAASRGFAVLGARPHPLLPPRLVSDVLHLAPGAERLAITVDLDIAPDGRLLSSRMFESAVRVATMLSESQAALSVGQADPLYERAPANIVCCLAEAARRAGHKGGGVRAVLAHCRGLVETAVGRWLREHRVPTLFAVGPGHYVADVTPQEKVDFCEPLASYAAVVAHQSFKAACTGALPPRSSEALNREAAMLGRAFWRAKQVAGPER
jgi:exoribonuclease R